MIVGINYHYVRPGFEYPFPGIVGLTTEAFRAQIELLGRSGEFIGQADLRRAFRDGHRLPDKAWLVTFDDGLREQFEHARPVLEALRVPAIFFANTQPLADGTPVLVHLTHLLRAHVDATTLLATLRDVADSLGLTLAHVNPDHAARQYQYDSQDVAELKYLFNFGLPPTGRDRLVEITFDRLLGWDRAEVCASLYMSKEQLSDLASRDQLGTHAHTHRALGELDAGTIRNEILFSSAYLETWTGIRPDAIAYPYGSRQACTPEVARAAAEAGMCLGFTMERAGIDARAKPLLLPRCAPNDVPGGSAVRWPGERVFEDIPSSTWYREAAPVSAAGAGGAGTGIA